LPDNMFGIAAGAGLTICQLDLGKIQKIVDYMLSNAVTFNAPDNDISSDHTGFVQITDHDDGACIDARNLPIVFKIETSIGDGQRRRHRLLNGVESRGLETFAEQVTVIYASKMGLLIEADLQLAVGEIIEANLPQAGLMEAKIIWVDGDIYGCRFTRQITRAAISAVPLGLRFYLTKPNSQPERSAMSEYQGVSSNASPLNKPLSLGAKIGIIVGLALSLWMIIGAAACWIDRGGLKNLHSGISGFSV
jgi:hypothetical protein